MLEAVCEAKVSDDNISVPIKEQILQLQITMDYLLLVDVPDARDKLSKQFASVLLLQISMSKNVIEKFAARGIFQDDSDIFVRLDYIV